MTSPTLGEGQHQEGLRLEVLPLLQRTDGGNTSLDTPEIDGGVVRLTPEESSQRKTPEHAVFREQSPEPPWGGESQSWGLNKKFSIKWILGSGAGVAAVVVGALWMLPLINRPNAMAMRAGQPMLALTFEGATSPSRDGDEMALRSDEAMRIFSEFIAAPAAEDILPVVRDRMAVEPLVRSGPRAMLVPREWSVDEASRWEVCQTDGLSYGVLSGRLPDFSNFTAYFILDGNQLRIDWKATCGHGSATFDELMENQGNPAEIRGWIKPSMHYNAAIPETSYRSYLLLAPDKVNAIWCYTRRGQPSGEPLDELFMRKSVLVVSPRARKVTLRLEPGPADALPNQWLVAEMLHKDWISP